MSDTPTKTYPPEFLQRLVDDHEAERQAAPELATEHRGDNLLQVEATELPGAAFADIKFEQAGATPEESSAVETKGDAMSDDLVNVSQRWPLRKTKNADTLAVEAYLQQSQRRDRYIEAVRALRDTLVRLQGGQPVSTWQMRDRVVELLDALLDMETHGGTR